MQRRLLKIFPVILLVILLSNCSSRMETPVINDAELSTNYPPKNSNGIDASINLFKGIDSKTKLPLTTNAFTLGNKSKVYANIELERDNSGQKEDLMLHIDWIDPEGNSFFRKRVDIPKTDSTFKIKSAISIEPGKRDTGNYRVRIYLFRELIAEKIFLLSSLNIDSLKLFSNNFSNRLSTDITIADKYNKNKRMPNDTVNVFYLNNKGRIYASVNLVNRNLFPKTEIESELTWSDPHDSVFYTKQITLTQYDSIPELNSSVSIDPKYRKPGEYRFKVYIYGNLVGEKSFLLKSPNKEKIHIVPVKGVSAKILFCKKFKKATKEAKGISDSFTIKNKAKVYAVIDMVDTKTKKDKSSKIKIEWIGPDNKPFYKKTFKYSSKNISDTISSSIFIAPQKRKPGNYKCRVYYNSALISEKNFNLLSSNL